jgi:general secretion pathway protein E/type IV pilus assembly protein PilB
LLVALPAPPDVDLLDSLAHVAGCPVTACVAAEAEIRDAVVRHYDRPARLIDQLMPADGSAGKTETAGLGREAGLVSAEGKEADAPIIRMVHDIILGAVHQRASDIHLEPLERRFRIRYRIDGVLAEAAAPAKRHQLAVISRLKIMANISIAEKRVPQDGRVQIALAGRTLDFRVSSLPTTHGESIVMRILDQTQLKLGLPELGFDAGDRAGLEQLIASPDGMVLVTGPTGSGKTTTLYSCLHHLNQADRKIITVEDPVEYQLAGVNQVPVRAEIGMTFAHALRAMLRQAPNIVMVGEIRDRETADMAVNAALTGHFVLSTLHTNDAPGAIARLTDIGVKPFLVAAALRASLAQRLVRRICPHCRQACQPAPRELQALGLTRAQISGAQFARGAGCSACHGTGYRGRLGIFETFLVNDDLRGLIHGKASAARLRQRAREGGMRTLREDGIRKVLAGLTTITEVASVTAGDID